MNETGVAQARLMHRQAVGAHHVLKGGALLADLQLAITVGALEVEVQIDEQLVDRLILETELLAQDQDPARAQTVMNALDQGSPLLGLNKLQGEVEHHHRGVLNLDVADIGLHQLHRHLGFETGEVGTGALDHGVGEIHRRDAATGLADMAAHRLSGGAQRTAEVIESALGLGVAGGHHADGRDDVAVTRHRALDHVGKDIDDLFVKAEITQTGDGGGKYLIFGMHAGAT